MKDLLGKLNELNFQNSKLSLQVSMLLQQKEKLLQELAILKRAHYGKSSEKLNNKIAEIQEKLENIEAKLAEEHGLNDDGDEIDDFQDNDKASKKSSPKRTKLFLVDGKVEVNNNIAERSIRSIALGRKNSLFAGSNSGGETAAAMYTIIETAKMSGLNPFEYLRTVLDRIQDHNSQKIPELLPWNIKL